MRIYLYLQFSRLIYANKNLLKVYYRLFYSLKGKEMANQKMKISGLIAARESIHLQLCKSKQDLHSKNLHKTSFYCCQKWVEIGHKWRYLFMKKDLENCYAHEMKNVHQYYTIIYHDTLSHETVEMLLGQKRKLEECLMMDVKNQ